MDRRQILILAAVLMLLTGVRAMAQTERPFRMLVIGDSHISGQGLLEENRFYYLVKQEIESSIFGGKRPVDLKVKAHAGSRITIHPKELKAMLKAGDDINVFRFREANLSAPSIKRQVEVARSEYAEPTDVDLVMFSGCITDVLVADIMSPFYPSKKLRERIQRFCSRSMTELLEEITSTFPRATVVVVGYAPISSKNTDVRMMARYFLRVASFPRKLEFIATNPVSRFLLKPLRNKFAARSENWITRSNSTISAAVDGVNDRLGSKRIIFVPSPFGSERSFGTQVPFVWGIGKDHRPDDQTYAERTAGCAKVFEEMTYQHYGFLSTRMCELSSAAHPNVEGSRAFAAAIIAALKPKLISGP